MENSGSSSKGSMVVGNQRKAFDGIRMGNPFTFKVGQVFTGFGVGCGVGIGVGRPINLGALPMLGQVMSATRGATDAFSGVSRHVNDALRKVGAKNIEAGIGCGVGFGHGFGIGLAIKPGVVHQIQSCVMQAVTNLTMKFGLAPNLSTTQGAVPLPLQSGLSTINEPSVLSPLGRVLQMAPNVSNQPFQGLSESEQGDMVTGSTCQKFASISPVETSFGRTENITSSFLHNTVLKEDDTRVNEFASQLRSENNMLQMVLKHQQIIEELMKENEKLSQIIMDHLKVPPSKFPSSYLSSSKSKSPCSECFECRRKQRKRWS
ncbi:hypothetical protein SLA2020_226990 [Shorea laevis]